MVKVELVSAGELCHPVSVGALVGSDHGADHVPDLPLLGGRDGGTRTSGGYEGGCVAWGCIAFHSASVYGP